jgi:hypothetical protein
MVSEKVDYRALAQGVVERDRHYSKVCMPTPEHVFLRWRGGVYKGSLQRFFSERPEIVYMTKSRHPYEPELADAIRSIDPDRQDFEVPHDADISMINHLMQVDGNRLMMPTSEQRKFFREHGPGAMLCLDVNLGGA